MKITIDNGIYSCSVDFSRLDTDESSFCPSVGDMIDAFLELLTSEFSQEAIAAYLVEGDMPMKDYYAHNSDHAD